MKWQEVDFASAKTKRSKYNVRPGNQATPPTRAELTKRKRINEDFNAINNYCGLCCKMLAKL